MTSIAPTSSTIVRYVLCFPAQYRTERFRLTLLSQQGYYTPSPFANLTSQPSKNISYCSNQTSFFHFDPAAVIQGELKPGVKLTDLSWPSAIQDGVHAVEDATDVMFVLYSTGATTTGVALIAALIGVRGVWRYSAITCVMLSSVCGPQVLPEAHDLARYVVANLTARFWLPPPCFIHREHRHQQSGQRNQ